MERVVGTETIGPGEIAGESHMFIDDESAAVAARVAWPGHATACSPFLATSVSSLSEAPRGRLSPRSHWLTSPVVTLR